MDHRADSPLAAQDLLIRAYRDQLRQLLEWALAHRDQFNPKVWNWQVHDVGEYIVRALGRVGVASTAELLRHYIHDAELGVAAVDAIRQDRGPCDRSALTTLRSPTPRYLDL